MKLWIRSQERDKLEDCHSLSIQPIVTPNKKHTTWGIVSNFCCIGEYATRERCLEIIDEIQTLLLASFVIIRNCEVGEDIYKYIKPTNGIAYQAENQPTSIEHQGQSVLVYEMPKE